MTATMPPDDEYMNDAISAALQAVHDSADRGQVPPRATVLAVEVAAPHIAAEALRKAIARLDELPGTSATGYYASGDAAGYREAVADIEVWLTRRAQSLLDGEPGS